MIRHDQPDCFSEDLIVAVSSRDDGTMLDRSLEDRHDHTVMVNRREFTNRAGVDYDACVYQIITYEESNTFDIIGQVDQPDMAGRHADALYTETPGLGLFLPVADCVAAVIYDSFRRSLAMAHLGRHSSVSKLMSKLIDFMKQQGSRDEDIVIWMAPSVAMDDYRMEYFDDVDDPDWQPYVKQDDDGVHMDLAGFNANLAVKAGVNPDKIYISSVNTASDPNYFSHSHGDVTGRFAVVAMIR